MGTYTADQAAPGRSWRAVTPSNSTNLPGGCRALWVGTAGDLSLVGDDDTAIVFTTPSNGYLLPLGPKRVNSTGTTASGIVAIY